ncbi:MAG: hypothetical protein II933_01850 [Candidatus Methanomethylophilaceae archaeon]|nr:hypothetical protein [Candidatus Methanomethylophilaceae archaeon]
MNQNEELMRCIQNGTFVTAIGIINDMASRRRHDTTLEECIRTMERRINSLDADERAVLFEKIRETVENRNLKYVRVRMSGGRVAITAKSGSRLPKVAAAVVIVAMLAVAGFAVAASVEADGIEFETDGEAVVAGQDTWIAVTVHPWFMIDKAVRWSADPQVVLVPRDGGVTVNVPMSMDGGKVRISATAKGGYTSYIELDVVAVDGLTIITKESRLEGSRGCEMELSNPTYNPNDKPVWEVVAGSATITTDETGYEAVMTLGADMAAGDTVTVRAGIYGSAVAATRSFIVDEPIRISILGQVPEARIGDTLVFQALCGVPVGYVWSVSPSDHVAISEEGDRLYVTVKPTISKGSYVTVKVSAGGSMNIATTKFQVSNEMSLVLSCPEGFLPGESVGISASVTPKIEGYDIVEWSVEGDVEWTSLSNILSIKVPVDAEKGDLVSVKATVAGTSISCTKVISISQSAMVKIDFPDTLAKGSEVFLYASVSPMGLADSLTWTTQSEWLEITPRGLSSLVTVSDAVPAGTMVSVTASLEGSSVSATVQMRVADITGGSVHGATVVIRTVEDLRAIGPVASGNYRLDSDLSLGQWVPIQMDGTFDGNGHEINGMSIDVLEADSSEKYYGVFSKVNGEVRNLRVSGSHVYFSTGLDCSGCVHAGIVAAVNNGIIRDVTVTCSWLLVNLDRSGTGALVGVNNGIVSGCSAISCDVFSNGDVGSIAGVVNGGTLEGCTVNGSSSNPAKVTLWSVNRQRSAGGIAGYVNSGAIIKDSVIGYLTLTLDGQVELKPAMGVVVGSLHASTLKGMTYDAGKVSRICDKQLVGWFLFICTYDYTENYYRSGWGYAGNTFGGCSIS